jgi:hypothetical protein
VQAVRRYSSGQIGYRAMYVRIGNPVVYSIDRMSRAGIGVQAVRRYGSGQIGYRAMYVRIGNPVVCSIDRT